MKGATKDLSDFFQSVLIVHSEFLSLYDKVVKGHRGLFVLTAGLLQVWDKLTPQVANPRGEVLPNEDITPP